MSNTRRTSDGDGGGLYGGRGGGVTVERRAQGVNGNEDEGRLGLTSASEGAENQRRRR